MIFEAINALYPKQAVDFVTVTAWLQDCGKLESAGGVTSLVELVDAIPSVANVQHYINVVKDKSMRRQFLLACRDASIQACTDEPLSGAVSNFQTTCLHLIIPDKKTGLISFARANREEWEVLQDDYEHEREPGLKTGFRRVDDETGGLRPGELWILCARPSMGKSSWAINVAVNVAKSGYPVFFFTLEMQNKAVWGRIVSRQSGVPFWLIRNVTLSSHDVERIITARGDLDEIPLWIDDSPALTPSDVMLRSQKIALENRIKPGLIIVDYLQIMRPDGMHQNREREVASMSTAAKQIAKELECPVMLLCQLNREVTKRSNQRPQLQDLRESGSIEQDADVVLGIYRQWPITQKEEHKTHAEIGILKQRNGPINWITDIQWNPHIVSFEDMSGEVNNPPPWNEAREAGEQPRLDHV